MTVQTYVIEVTKLVQLETKRLKELHKKKLITTKELQVAYKALDNVRANFAFYVKNEAEQNAHPNA